MKPEPVPGRVCGGSSSSGCWRRKGKGWNRRPPSTGFSTRIVTTAPETSSTMGAKPCWKFRLSSRWSCWSEAPMASSASWTAAIDRGVRSSSAARKRPAAKARAAVRATLILDRRASFISSVGLKWRGARGPAVCTRPFDVRRGRTVVRIEAPQGRFRTAAPGSYPSASAGSRPLRRRPRFPSTRPATPPPPRGSPPGATVSEPFDACIGVSDPWSPGGCRATR